MSWVILCPSRPIEAQTETETLADLPKNFSVTDAEELARKKFFPKIWATSDVDFGEAFSGDPMRKIPAGKWESPENGSFLIWGLPFKHYEILLPRYADMKRVSSRPGRGPSKFRVADFTSYPAEEFRLNVLGLRKVYIGATRDALPKKLLPGRYDGSYLLILLSH